MAMYPVLLTIAFSLTLPNAPGGPFCQAPCCVSMGHASADMCDMPHGTPKVSCHGGHGVHPLVPKAPELPGVHPVGYPLSADPLSPGKQAQPIRSSSEGRAPPLSLIRAHTVALLC